MVVNTDYTSRERNRPIDYAKKYWWAAAIVVPLLSAAIAKWPMKTGEQPTSATTINGNNNTTNSNNTAITIGGNKYEFSASVNVVNADPGARSKVNQGIERLQAQDYGGAIQLLEQVPDNDRDAQLWNILGLAYVGAGDMSHARAALAKAQSKAPTDAAVMANVARLDEGNDILHPKEIGLNATIDGAIGDPSDGDFFSFTMTEPTRNFVDVVLTNRSTTLRPGITVYNPDKSQQDYRNGSNPGANVSYSFVAEPNSRYYVQVYSCCWSKSSGSYRLAIDPRKVTDVYEPNDDILHPSHIEIGKVVKAGIMDSRDVDFYTFETDQAGKLVVSLENRSTTLAPGINVYNPDKSQLDYRISNTPGADVSYTLAAQPKSRYYVAVYSCCGSNTSGDYTLTVRPE